MNIFWNQTYSEIVLTLLSNEWLKTISIYKAESKQEQFF